MISLVLVLGLDQMLATAPESVWRSIRASVPDRGREPSRVGQLLTLARLRAERPKDPLIVFGSSQAGVIFSRTPAHPTVLVLAQSGGGPREALSVAPLIGPGPGTAAILAGAVDTHARRPLQARQLGRSLSVPRFLAGSGRWGRLWRERGEVLRMLASYSLFTYHVRPILGVAGLDEGRRFAPLPAPDRPRARASLRRRLQSLLSRFPPEAEAAVLGQAPLVSQLRADARSQLNLEYLRELAHTLRSAGWRVVIVEPPLNPLARELYDPEIDLQFRDFARRLVDEGLVDRFVGLEGMPHTEPADFTDLSHMTEEAGARYQLALLPLILDPRSPSRPPRDSP